MSFLTEMLHFFSRQKCAKNGTFPLVVKDMLFFLIEAHKWRQLNINPHYFEGLLAKEARIILQKYRPSRTW